MEKSNNNEIKKALYKEKPIAKLAESDKYCYRYIAQTSLGFVTFEVPISDMGDAKFEPYMPAQLLIRWM